jgi:hypothetical protein
MTILQPRRLLAVAHMILVVAFVAGSVIVASSQRARDVELRRAGVVLMVVSAALIFVRLGVGELMSSMRAEAR